MTTTWECDALDAAGTPVHLRPICPDDTAALIDFHRGLSTETIYYRFFSVHPELSAKEAEHFTHVDGHNRAALVALAGERIVGVGRYDRSPGTSDAEVAFAVADRQLRHAAATITAAVGGPAGFVVQPMVDTGVEMIAGITHDPAFGPLVMVGAGGVHAELLGDRSLRILPLTDRDAAEAVRSLRLAPLLFGYRGRPRAAVDRLEDLLLRLARLSEDHPDIAELDCNPVLVTPIAAQVVDAKVRLARPADLPPDHLRRLR